MVSVPEQGVISKPKTEYLTDEYFALDLPVAPVIMVGSEIVTEEMDIDDHSVEIVIGKQLAICRDLRMKRKA